ncbi:MAG TPA: hypothetical protein VK588_13750, partial [Chitinophagaceae bacterium]|nr:hypothetical protein [Chitinophagaceae bacterium]
MNPINEIANQLITFRDCNKFEVYQDRQPAVKNSTREDQQYVNDEINSCCDQLLQYLETDSPQDKGLWTIVRNSINRIEDAMLDTEDREFCYELYQVLGQ